MALRAQQPRNNNPPIKPIIEYYNGKVSRDSMTWQKIRCPFHGDQHASAAVNMSDNIFVCHGCGIKGNAFNIIMNQEGVSFREAVTIAEGILGTGSGALRAVHPGSRGISEPTRFKRGGSRLRLARGSE